VKDEVQNRWPPELKLTGNQTFILHFRLLFRHHVESKLQSILQLDGAADRGKGFMPRSDCFSENDPRRAADPVTAASRSRFWVTPCMVVAMIRARYRPAIRLAEMLLLRKTISKTSSDRAPAPAWYVQSPDDSFSSRNW
jgi:hypothetical protein